MACETSLMWLVARGSWLVARGSGLVAFGRQCLIPVSAVVVKSLIVSFFFGRARTISLLIINHG
jgi:hypothetical protein